MKNWREKVDNFVCLLGWAFIGVLFYFFLVVIIHGKEETMRNKSCRLAMVEWQDAVIYAKASEVFSLDKPLTSPSISIGCLLERKNDLIVIHGFQNGKPDDFIVLPRGWVMKITYLKPKDLGSKEGIHVDSTVGADSSAKH